MPKPSHREKILAEGMRLIHRQGFANSGVRDIVKAAGVPQGSFTNHFASKEMFGLAVIDLYFVGTREVLQKTLRNDALPPLERLEQWIELNKANLSKGEMRNGCLFGNFAAEASDSSELIRKRLVEIFAEIQESVAYCLKAAIAAGEVPASVDANETAAFIVASMQGANLMSKTFHDAAPVNRLKRILFSAILGKQ